MERLTKAIERAVRRMKRDGVEGWGLNNPNKEIFDVVVTGGPKGCDSDTCRHVSHDGADYYYKIFPKKKDAEFVLLGEDEKGENYYYLYKDEEQELFFHLRDGGHYHDRIWQVEPEEIPEFILSEFAAE